MADNMSRRASFNFVGEVVTGKELVTDQKMGASEWMKKRLSIGVKNENNMQFLNMEYIHNPKIKTTKIFFEDGTSEDVQWENTFNPDIINRVSDMNRIIVDLEKDFNNKNEYTKLLFRRRNHEIKEEKTEDDIQKIAEYTAQINELAINRMEFVHIKDVIDFLAASVDILKGCKVKVTGTVKSNYYKGKNSLQYIPSRIELVPEETPNQLKANIDFFYDKDGINDDTKEKRMIVNGWICERVKKADKLYPLAITLDYSKVDDTVEQQAMLLKYMKNTFKITNKKQVHKMGLEVAIQNGSEVVEFNEDCLTENQRMGIMLGINTLDDFKPKGNVYGTRIQELRLSRPDVKSYPEGSVEVFASDDLSDLIASDDSDKKAEDLKVKDAPKIEEPKKEEQSADALMAALFGN